MSGRERKNHVDGENLSTHYPYFSNIDFYEEAYKQANGQIFSTKDKIYGGIIPHHLIVKDKIAAFFESIANNNYETIVLMGPNHAAAGQNDIIISQSKWQTPYGELRPDLDLIANLNELNPGRGENLFASEHSISSLVGFIKRSFPNAKLVPIIIKPNTTKKTCDRLANNLKKYTNLDKTLVLASVDFSHYQPANVADWHDQKSLNVIEDFDYDNLYNLEIDSPSTIYTLLKYLDLGGVKKSKLIFSTNSGNLMNKPDEPTTSHNFFYFQKGANQIKEKTVSFLFFGDLMLDRHVREKIDKNGFQWLMAKIAGEENRFFKGVDIIMANLEGAVTNNGGHYPPAMSYDFAFTPELIRELRNYGFNAFTIANNHITDQGETGFQETQKNLDNLKINYAGCPDGQMDNCSSKIVEATGKKIALLAYSMVYGSLAEDKLFAQIKDAKEKSDLIIVNMHWGTEYQQKHNVSQEDLAYKIIDSGADIIIGHHPHVAQDIEIYKGKPIFYSLGNFIFDQYFSKETQRGLAIGTTWQGKKFEIYLFPLKSEFSQAQLMAGTEKNEFLNWLADNSEVNDGFRKEIKNGRLKLNF